MEAVDAQQQHVLNAAAMVMRAIVVSESRRRHERLPRKRHSDCRRPSALWHPHASLLLFWIEEKDLAIRK
ncbi:hypothetical protein [Bradyrhizobium sp. ORS 111]|uniref:hypothetical protein n=1 Tax=Bradyrhizobium sp. ORS 111 TaxID=1685958 RepID=UPI003890B809